MILARAKVDFLALLSGYMYRALIYLAYSLLGGFSVGLALFIIIIAFTAWRVDILIPDLLGLMDETISSEIFWHRHITTIILMATVLVMVCFEKTLLEF